MNILILNGPNLNLLGKRQPEIYGSENFEHYFLTLQKEYYKIRLKYLQTNHEGNIIDALHEYGFTYTGIILNAAAYTHYSYAIADAIAAITTPVVEVHISDIYAREEFRHTSVIKPHCKAQINGKGLLGYKEALDLLIM